MRAMLHIINHSSFNKNDALIRLLDADVQRSATILLIEDGVYSAVADAQNDLTMVLAKPENKFSLYALRPDVIARGLLDKLLPNVQLINYEDFVDLTVQHYPIQSWS